MTTPPPLSLAVLVAAGFGAYAGHFGMMEPSNDGAKAANDPGASNSSQTLSG